MRDKNARREQHVDDQAEIPMEWNGQTLEDIFIAFARFVFSHFSRRRRVIN